MEAHRARHRLGVAIPSLLVATTLGNLFLAWVEMGLRECREQHAAEEALRRVGGGVFYDWMTFPMGTYTLLGFGPHEFLHATPWWNSRRWMALAASRLELVESRLRGLNAYQRGYPTFLSKYATVGEVNFGAHRAMTDTEWKYFCGAFASARGVQICCPIYDAQLRHLARMKNLEAIVIVNYEEGPSVTGEGLVHLAGLRRLRSLSLHAVRLSDAGRKALGKLESLEGLELSNEADDETLAHLTGLKHLKYLVASTETTNAGLFHIGKMSSLRSLDLAHTRITDDGLRHLVGLKITELDVRGTGISDRGVAYLAQLPELSELYLPETAITDAAALYLAKLRRLESLGLGHTALTDAAIPNLETLKNLKSLGLHGTKISIAGCEKLRAALPRLERLQTPDGRNILTEHTNGKTKETRPKIPRAQVEAGKR